MSEPQFYEWGGGGVPKSWSWGWLTGPDNDLVCIIPDVLTSEIAERTLSPVAPTQYAAWQLSVEALQTEATKLRKEIKRLDELEHSVIWVINHFAARR